MVLGKVIYKPFGKRKPNFPTRANIYQPFTRIKLNPMKWPIFSSFELQKQQFHRVSPRVSRQRHEGHWGQIMFLQGAVPCIVDVRQHPWLLLTKGWYKPPS